jgi:phosphomannomutase
MVERSGSLSRWSGSLPDLAMVKIEVPLSAEPDWTRVRSILLGVVVGGEEDLRDGIRVASGQEWVHLRKSGTEPVVRVIAEAPTPDRARTLAEAARGALG